MTLPPLPAPEAGSLLAVPQEESSARGGRTLGSIAAAVRWVAYPVLLMAAAVTVIVSIRLGARLPFISFCFVGFAFGYLALLERVIPYDKRLSPMTKGYPL